MGHLEFKLFLFKRHAGHAAEAVAAFERAMLVGGNTDGDTAGDGALVALAPTATVVGVKYAVQLRDATGGLVTEEDARAELDHRRARTGRTRQTLQLSAKSQRLGEI